MPATPFLAVCFPNMKHSYENKALPTGRLCNRLLGVLRFIKNVGGKKQDRKFLPLGQIGSTTGQRLGGGGMCQCFFWGCLHKLDDLLGDSGMAFLVRMDAIRTEAGLIVAHL